MDKNDIKKRVTEVTAKIPERAPRVKATLVVIDGWEEGMEYELDDFPVFIGRDEACTVCLPVPSVSRQHAVISRKVDKFFIKDQDSTNGTYINNKIITEAEIKHGDEITVGEVTLKFLVEKEGDPRKVYVIDSE